MSLTPNEGFELGAVNLVPQLLSFLVIVGVEGAVHSQHTECLVEVGPLKGLAISELLAHSEVAVELVNQSSHNSFLLLIVGLFRSLYLYYSTTITICQELLGKNLNIFFLRELV